MAVTPGYCSRNEHGTWTWTVLNNGIQVEIGTANTKEEAQEDQAKMIEEVKRRHKIITPSYKQHPPYEPDRER